MKSVLNWISNIHQFYPIFIPFLAIFLELRIDFLDLFKSWNFLAWGPPVSLPSLSSYCVRSLPRPCFPSLPRCARGCYCALTAKLLLPPRVHPRLKAKLHPRTPTAFPFLPPCGRSAPPPLLPPQLHSDRPFHRTPTSTRHSIGSAPPSSYSSAAAHPRRTLKPPPFPFSPSVTSSATNTTSAKSVAIGNHFVCLSLRIGAP
jgi:hypothetical protein